MKTITLTVEELISIINANERIGVGSYGIVVKLYDGYLFKFCYKDFIDCFKKDNNRILLKLENAQEISAEIACRKNIDKILNGGKEPLRVKNIRLLMSKQKNVKHSTLTQGFVYVNNYCVGYLLKHHKNMVNLHDYVKKNNISLKEQQTILLNIKVAMLELLDNAIYLNDFTMHNIMYNPQTSEIQIIDFEDSVSCYPTKDKFSEKLMLEKYEKIKNFFKERENTL